MFIAFSRQLRFHVFLLLKMTFADSRLLGAEQPLWNAQMRAARALIHWSAEDLARETALSVTTIRRAELTDEETSMTAANDLAVRRALEAAGVEFIDDNGGGAGVRLRQRQRPKAAEKSCSG